MRQGESLPSDWSPGAHLVSGSIATPPFSRVHPLNVGWPLLSDQHAGSENAALGVRSDRSSAPVCRIDRHGTESDAVYADLGKYRSPDHGCGVETPAAQRFSRGMISRAMISICSLWDLEGRKISFGVPTARGAVTS